MHLRVPLAQTLPNELIGQIVDHLHDDHPTLRSCALVSRSCCVAAQYHIFHRIEEYAVTGEDSFQSLGYFLASAPLVCGYVRSLVLSGGFETASQSNSVCQHTLSTLLSYLPALRVADLYNVSLACYCDDDFPLAPRIKLEALIIRSSEISTLRTFTAVLGLFSEVNRLEIAFLQMFPMSDLRLLSRGALGEALPLHTTTPLVEVHSLTLRQYVDYPATAALCDILLATLDLDSLATLSMNFKSELGLLAYSGLLRSVSSSLREMTLAHEQTGLSGIAPQVECTYQQYRVAYDISDYLIRV